MSSKTKKILSKKVGSQDVQDMARIENNGEAQKLYTDPDLALKIDSIYNLLSTGAATNVKEASHPVTIHTSSQSTCSGEKMDELTEVFQTQKAISYLYQNHIEMNALANAAKAIKEHISHQQNLVKNKELVLSNAALRALKPILNQNEKTEKEYNKVQVSSKNILTSSLNDKSAKIELKKIALQTKEDCQSETCFEESDLIRNVCGALKYGGFFEDSDS